MPLDPDDLDGDNNLGEALPVEARGLGFLRLAGGQPDIGAVERQGPVFSSPISDTTHVHENTTEVSSLVASNPEDPTATVTFAIEGSGPDDTFFEIINGNELRFLSAPDAEAPLDSDGNNIYEVDLRATDSNGRFNLLALKVTVVDIAEVSHLIAYWTFDHSIGNTIIDVSGNNLSGITSGSADLTKGNGGLIGEALDLSGNNAAQDKMTVSSAQFTPHNPGNDSFSVSFWVKPTTLGGLVDHAGTDGYDISAGTNIGIVLGSGGAQGHIDYGLPGTTNLSLNANETWQHVALIVDRTASTYACYIDGVPEKYFTFSPGYEDLWRIGNIPGTIGSIDLDAQDLRLGEKNGNTGFEGLIDDYAIYNIALTPSQVAGLADKTLTPVTVTSGGSAFESWALGFFPGQTSPNFIGANADPNLDGFANALTFLLGGDPTSPNGTSLPTTTKDQTYLNVTYRRNDATLSWQPRLEYSTDLVNWTTATDGVDGVIIESDDDFYGIDSQGNGIDRVRVRLPHNDETNVFTRLAIDP